MSAGVSTFLASVATYTVLLTVVVAVVERVGRRDGLAAALTAHGVVPAGAVRPLAVAVTAAEVGIGALLLAGLLRDATAMVTIALFGAVGLFAAYGGYGRYLTATGRGGPCGCGRTEVPMSGWVVARAFALAGLAGVAVVTVLVGGIGSGAALPLTEPGSTLVVTLLAAGTFSALLWHLPTAMHDPLASGVSA